MGRRFLIIALLLVVALCAYMGYNRYDARRAGVSGDVFSPDSKSAPDNTPTSSHPNTTQAVLSSLQPQPSATAEPPVQSSQSTSGQPPATDTISPNPPNGMVFSGSGRFQVYRQGDLTWRMDTNTGDSCILFATDEEWKKPKVYRNGCRGR